MQIIGNARDKERRDALQAAAVARNELIEDLSEKIFNILVPRYMNIPMDTRIYAFDTVYKVFIGNIENVLFHGVKDIKKFVKDHKSDMADDLLALKDNPQDIDLKEIINVQDIGDTRNHFLRDAPKISKIYLNHNQTERVELDTKIGDIVTEFLMKQPTYQSFVDFMKKDFTINKDSTKENIEAQLEKFANS
jgi:hypothetical protein